MVSTVMRIDEWKDTNEVHVGQRVVNDRTATRRAIAGNCRRRATTNSPRSVKRGTTHTDRYRRSKDSMSSPFTLTIDWLAFTLPSGSVQDTMQMIEGTWTKSEVGFRGYPDSWITAGVGRGVGKLGTGASRAPREVHVDLSGGIVAPGQREGPDGAPMDLEARGSPDATRLCLRRSAQLCPSLDHQTGY